MCAEYRYLLIISCSQRKLTDPGLLPAIERYDGVNYRVLKKAMREGYWPRTLDVLILSAKHGLLRLDSPIEDYDVRMTRDQALALQSEASSALDACLAQADYREVFINLGKTYLMVLAQSKKIPCLKERIHYADGGIGEKMSQMKEWLLKVCEREGSSNGLSAIPQEV